MRPYPGILLVVLLLLCSSQQSRSQNLYAKTIGFLYPVQLYSMAPTPDSGCVAVGLIGNASGISNALLIKIKMDGSLAWAKEFTIPYSGSGAAPRVVLREVSVDPSGNIICSGDIRSGSDQPYVAAFNSAGVLLWSKGYKLFTNTNIYFQTSLHDNSILIGGSCNNWDLAYGVLAVITSTGTVRWAKTHETGHNFFYDFNCALELPDHSFICAGRNILAFSAPNPSDPLALVQFKADGSVIQQTVYIDTGYAFDPQSLAVLTDSSGEIRRIIIGGARVDTKNNYEVYPGLIAVDKTLKPMWAAMDISSPGHTIIQVSTTASDMLLTTSSTISNSKCSIPSKVQLYTADGQLDSRFSLQLVTNPIGSAFVRPLSPGQFLGLGTNFKAVSTALPITFTITASLESCLSTAVSLPLTDAVTLGYRKGDIETTGIHLDTISNGVVIKSILPPKPEKECETILTSVSSPTEECRTRLYPNPVSVGTELVLNIPPLTATPMQLVLGDLLGHTVYSQVIEASVGTEEVRIPTIGLTSGLYIVTVSDPVTQNAMWQTKVIVR